MKYPYLSLLLVGIMAIQLSNCLQCYEGMDGNYAAMDCRECEPGIGCQCVKIPDFQGQEIKMCRINPQNAIRPGCGIAGFYQGLPTEMCLCDENLCNSSTEIKPSQFLTSIATSILLFLILKIH